MTIDPKFFMHESDRKALQALQAIPGFTQAFKAFMKVWSEKQMRIVNMSTNLRISEKQLPRYHAMLIPICEKLGIDVPELYLELDVNANAYTAGDTEPFIVVTSGLLETLPEALIPTVLAHECGHIACHHCLYTTMGRFILGGAITALGLNELAVLPIQVAFFYWMRCSELSADRAAALCDGGSEKVIEMCMRFAGLDKDVQGRADAEEFMNQARDYLEMVEDSSWNRTLEFLTLSGEDHPMNAVRAYECARWTDTDRFRKLCRYLEGGGGSAAECLGEIPMQEPSRHYIGRDCREAVTELWGLGLRDVKGVRTIQKGLITRNGAVVDIQVNGEMGFEMGQWIPVDAAVRVFYYQEQTEEELAAAHPGQGRMPEASRKFLGSPWQKVVRELQDAGFTDITAEPGHMERKSWLIRENGVTLISVNGQTRFERGDWFDFDAKIRLHYYQAEE